MTANRWTRLASIHHLSEKNTLPFLRPVPALLALLAALPFAAVTADEPVIVGWTEVAPFYLRGDDGQPTGFAAELMRHIADLADIEITFQHRPDPKALLDGLATGEVTVLPAIPSFPHHAAHAVFSTPVAKTRNRLYVRSEDSHLIGLQDLDGQRIGILPPLMNDQMREAYKGSSFVKLEQDRLLMALLSGDVDAILGADHAILGQAHATRLDHRITVSGAPLKKWDRVVALHQSRANLLERVNAAIAELEESGTLTELRRRWFLDTPPPAPDILIVGVNHFPPHNIVNADGSFTGYSVETFRDLAELAGLELEFRQITLDEWRLGPAPGRYDITPQAGISDERLEKMDFTLPVQRAPFSIFVRAGEGFRIAGLDDLVGRRVGVTKANLARRLAEAHGGLDLTVLSDVDELLPALLTHRVDAILFPTSAIRDLIKQGGLNDRIDEIRPPFFVSERAPALRFGLGNVRERLNAVIPSYLISEDHETLIAEWFGGKSHYWTRDRVQQLMIAAAGLILLLTGLILYLLRRRRHHIKDERRRYAAEIAEHIPIGLLLVSPDGTIDFANREIKEKTPGGADFFTEGHPYQAAIKAMIEKGIVDTQGLTPDDMLKLMTEDGLVDGYAKEFQLKGDQGAFLRSTKRLQSGSALIVRQDISEYKEKQRQIEALNTDLAEQIRLAKLANDELRAFAYATSHDLKAPANTLMMTIDALTEDLKAKHPATDLHLLNVATRTIQGMRCLIDDVLTYTDTIGATQKREPVDLNKVAADVIDALGADIKISAAEINLAPLPSLQANPAQLHQLVQNLISNAVKFRTAETTPAIDVKPAEAPPGYVAFKIKDNGIGIAPEHQDKVFQLFARFNRRSAYKGTGLGLAICQRIALNHGGRIDLQSSPGQGSCFTVLLEEKADDSPSHSR